MRELILRLARENRSWGYLRIVGELRKLGIAVSATSVGNILAQAGLPPAPQRDRQSWRTFLRTRRESIVACDCFTVDTVWLRRLYVLVFLSIGSHRAEYFACKRAKSGPRLEQRQNAPPGFPIVRVATARGVTWTRNTNITAPPSG